MGGPCQLRSKSGGRKPGPPCTDNFQCIPFTYDGREWLSAEQCFQAMKFTDRSTQEPKKTRTGGTYEAVRDEAMRRTS